MLDIEAKIEFKDDKKAKHQSVECSLTISLSDFDTHGQFSLVGMGTDSQEAFDNVQKILPEFIERLQNEITAVVIEPDAIADQQRRYKENQRFF